MDMDTNQDFDLEDILKEFSEHKEAEEPEAPAGQMPELRFDEEPVLSDTREFSPVEEPASDAITTDEPASAVPPTDEPTIVMDLPEEPEAGTETSTEAARPWLPSGFSRSVSRSLRI